jgi:tetratricopeptide (TPR) repeat protein
MPAFRWDCLILSLLASLFCVNSSTLVFAQDDLDDATEEERKQTEAVARFVTVLEKNPRRGTAFDRVYGHYVEFGTINSFIAELEKRAANAKSKGEHWMILGMIEYQRGNDAEAVNAFTKAESIRTNDPLPAYYLGQAQIRIGDSNAAVASFERALDRKPPRADQLEIFQQLGRLHQRAQRTDEAMKVWKRLEELYPDDARVLEQIAVTLNEEGQFAEALPRYEKLASTTKDDYRKTTFAIAAAELVVKQGDKSGGIKRMEKLLAELNPDGWLYRDVRRRIDDCFLRTGDQDGLVAYYQAWLDTHPQDIEAMNRLARFLKQSARNPEAATWLNKALTLAPKRADIRKTYIDLLAEDKRFADAASQFEQLLSAAPGNADYLRDWGKMILRNKETPEQERRKKALSVWNRIIETIPKDAVLVSQVADLCRQNQMPEEAESLYRKAIELAPQEPQYREYLGEFLHIQKRVDEAKAVWKEIAAGDLRNEVNLSRLAEIYNSFGFSEEACEKIAESIELAPKDFALVIKGAEYHNKASRFDGAMKLVDQAEKLIANDDERESVLNTRINVLQSSQQLDAEAEKLEQQFLANANTTAQEWYQLARYRESQRQWDDAATAIDKAIEKDPQSVLSFTAAARIAESAGDFGRAADLFRKLTQVDRRSISDHLTSVARLEVQMGRKEQALEAAKQLIVAAPSKTENYEFYAQTCFRLGEFDEGMQALRKAIRINPNEPSLMMTLGASLADQLRTEEAIELYWRAYEKSDEVSDKTTMVTKLVPLYLQLNQLDKLFERLQRERQEEESRRSATICIAQAWQTAGDIAEARRELEGLLSENTKDTNLLNQLAKLCQEDADMDSAINYQRQLVSLAPGDETESPLASMLLRAGEVEEAREIYAKLIASEEDPVRQLRSLDSLLNTGIYDTAMRVMEPLLDKQRDDWELLYRYGVCWQGLNNDEEARTRFEQILALPLPHDTLGRAAAAKLKQAQEKARSDNLRGINTVVPARESALQMMSKAPMVRSAVGLITEDYYSGSPMTVWTPESYGLARMASMGWIIRMEQDRLLRQPVASSSTDGTQESKTFADSVRDTGTASGATTRDVLDWLYVAALKDDYASIFSIAKQLAATGDVEEKRYFLQSLRTREMSSSANRSNRPNIPATRTPLSDADLELAQKCFDYVDSKVKDQSLEAIYGPNIAFDGNGQAYVLVGSSYQMLPGVFRNSGGFRVILMEEYRFAGKKERIDELIEQQLKAATTSADWIAALNTLRQEERKTEISGAFEKWREVALKEILERPVVANSARNTTNRSNPLPLVAAMNFLQQWIGALGEEEENEKILKIFESIMVLAEAESQFRSNVAAASKLSPAAPTGQPSSVFNIQTYYGKTVNQVSITFPPITAELDTTAITCLRQVFEVLNKNGVSGDIVSKIRTKTGTETRNAIFWKWCLASVLWWSEEQDEAMQIVTTIIESNPSNLDMQFQFAALLETRSAFEDALSIINKISARDQTRLIRKENIALRLAERIGDSDRAREAAERLFGLRLSSDMQMQLIPQLKRLGLEAQADAMMNRMERASSRQPGTLLSLMNMYQSQSKKENADQAAMAILRKTTSPYSASNSPSGMFSPNTRSGDSSQRTAALQHLSRSGALKKMVEQLKEKLERSPNSFHTIQQLIEYSMALNQKQEADQYLAKALELRPDSHLLRWNLASELMGKRKFSEACDQYLLILDAQPNWVMEQYWEIRQAFTQAKRQKELMAKIEKMDIARFRNPYGLLNMISNSLEEDPASAESLVGLVERVFAAYPNYRTNLLNSLINNPALLKNDRMFELVKQSIIADSQSASAYGNWSGLDYVTSYSTQSINVPFSNLISMAKLTPSRTQELTNVFGQQTQKNPNWLGGQAMMALIELSGKSKEAGQKRMEAILAKEETIKNMPYEACWFIGQELATNKAMEPLAIRLLKEADARQVNNGMNDLNYTPLGTLVRVLGNRPEERSFLKKCIEEREKSAASQMVTYGDPGYDSYQKAQRALSLSRAYLSIGCPVDAFLAVKSVEGNYDAAAANRWMGGANEVQSQMQRAMDSATSAINDQNLTESLDRLLPLDRPIDLMVKTPMNSGKENSKTTAMRSELLGLLRAAAREEATKQSISNRLSELVKSRPTELSIRIMHALWLMDQDCDANTLAPELKQLIELTKLEPIPEGRRPNSRQRQEAKLIMHQWLVVREVLTDNAPTVTEKLSDSSSEDKPAPTKQSRRRSFASNEECRQIAKQIAEQAVEAGMRQLTRAEQCAVLLELASLQATQKDLDQAEKNWQRLLSLATTTIGQPSMLSKAEEKTSKDESNPNAKPARQPPLTISQFRIVLAVHNMAAENGRMDIAASALGASLRGGLPVADPDTSAPDPRRNLVAANSGPPKPAVDPIEQEAQNTIRKSLNYWNTSGEAPPEILNALRLVILPTSRPEEIRPYVNGAAVETGREESLASLMVKIASKTNQLDSLKKDIESRNAKATSLLAKKVILTLIAIEKNDFETAKALIEELNRESEKISAQSSVQILGIAALRAFSIPELKDAAIPVLKKLSVAQLAKMEKNENSDDDTPDSSIDVFAKDLPLKLNKYLVAKGDTVSVRETLDSFLQQRASTYDRYSDSSYLQYLQRDDLQQLAHYASNLGMFDYAADLAGRYADLTSDERYGGSTFHISMALEHLVTSNRALSPEARFKTWYDWTIPKENPANIRFIASWPKSEMIPKSIASLLQKELQNHDNPVERTFNSNLSELVFAAVETKRLETLKNDLEKSTYAESRNAKLLLQLIAIEQKDAPAVKNLITDRIAQHYEWKSNRGRNNGYYASDSTRSMEDSLLIDACEKNGFEIEAMKLRKLFAQTARTKDVDHQTDQYWISQNYRKSHAPNATWSNNPNQPLAITSWMRSPLMGSFTISFDCPRSTSTVEFGGVRIDWGTGALTDSSGLYVPLPTARSESSTYRVEIRSEKDTVNFKIDGVDVTTEPTWGTSPWLSIANQLDSHQWRNLRIDGTPTVPVEVPLISQDSMDGWNSLAYGDTQKQPRLTSERKQINKTNPSNRRPVPPTPDSSITWSVENGNLKARATPQTGSAPIVSCLKYQRPLCDGETIRYEFFAKQELSVAHPTVDNIAMVFKADGLYLQYLHDQLRPGKYSIIEAERLFKVELTNGATAAWPLKDEEWNNVSLTCRKDKVELSLNDTLIYSLPLDPGTPTHFGFFRYKHQESLIRNVTLSGPWSTDVNETLVADWNANSKAHRVKRSIDQTTNRENYGLVPMDWSSITKEDNNVGSDTGMSELMDLVLPPAGKNPRFSFQVAEYASSNEKSRSTLELDCVAVELVKFAKKHNKTSELNKVLDDYEQKWPEAKRGIGAIRCLMAIETADESIARKSLEGYIEAMLLDDLDLLRHANQTADFVVAWRASRIPGLHDLATKMLDRLQELDREERTRTPDPVLIKWVKRLAGDLKYFADKEFVGAAINLRPQWTPLQFGNPRHGTNGGVNDHYSTWIATRGKAVHYGSDLSSPLIFQSPLTGKFEVIVERTTFDRQEVSIMYAMHAAEPKYDLSAVSVSNRKSVFDQGSAIEVPGFLDKSRAKFRIVVDGDSVSTYTNDVLIHEQSVAEATSPWLMLEAIYPDFRCEVEDLRIIGSPAIPEELVLTNVSTAEDWDGTLSGQSVSRNENRLTGWVFRNREVTSDKLSVSPYKENYIRYLRPMLEDGVVEYEFWYDEKSEVHPAIGSQAFLLRKEGLQIHRITMLSEDQPAPRSNNASPLEPPSKPIDLKSADWNQVRLELKGNDLSVTVNGNNVGTVLIKDPAHLRHIGMLHFGGTQARFRNMTYRGEWPKTLPPVSEQILAQPDAKQ